jgi:hypothetical protein
MEPEMSLLRSKEPVTGPYSEPIHNLSTYSFMIHFNIIILLMPKVSKTVFRSPIPWCMPHQSRLLITLVHWELVCHCRGFSNVRRTMEGKDSICNPDVVHTKTTTLRQGPCSEIRTLNVSSSALWRRMGLVRTDVAEGRVAYIFRLEW